MNLPLIVLLLIVYSGNAFANGEADTPVRYYPGSTSLPVGSEEYLKNHSSLAGIEGVYVVLEYVEGSAKKNSISMPDDLEEQVTKRLNDAGLKFLTKEEMESTPGMPELAIYPAYSGGTIGATIPTGDGSVNSTDKENDCCRNSVWMSFMQSASILRRPDSQYKFGTWGAGDDSDWCDNRGQWMYGAVLKVIDEFIKDYKKAEAEKLPVKVASVQEVPVNCAQAWSLHEQVFETNSTQPNDRFMSILKTMAQQSKRCSNYSYLIETHADSRADAQYNQLLTEARAGSIKEILMSHGVTYKRLKSLAYGESRPLTEGTTEADHAANRRVVILPVLGGKFAAMAEE